MNMLVRPAPFPEELDRGYLGRLMRINGYRTHREFLVAAAEDCGRSEGLGRDISNLVLLSQIAKMTTEEFACRHTLIPLSRAIAVVAPHIHHGSIQDRTFEMGIRRPLRNCPHATFFCAGCAEADLKFHGVSYWRREHQVPGQLWCPKHRSPLHVSVGQTSYLSSPAHWRDKTNPLPETQINASMENEAVARFLAIASGLIDEPIPLDGLAVAQELRVAGRAQGFADPRRRRRPKSDPLMSDQICASFPKQWLGVVYPPLSNRSKGDVFPAIDDMFYGSTRPGCVRTFLLTLATLYPNAEAALNAMRRVRSRSGCLATKYQERMKRKSSSIWIWGSPPSEE